ncbi:Lipid-A-disaccharide synthase [Dissostichus eleginoides]|uniref:Lipid-A-disaccharide synthase n=1 Tax=Dissostichus eleginoides TaxID=100907 RepID=A0AAD9CDL5_DISEL|nr:Lipid-A-disaccharide synthase [Dissostichus eleginoides]
MAPTGSVSMAAWAESPHPRAPRGSVSSHVRRTAENFEELVSERRAALHSHRSPVCFCGRGGERDARQGFDCLWFWAFFHSTSKHQPHHWFY